MNRLYKHEDVVQMLVDVIEQAEQNNGIVIVDRPMGWKSIRDYAEEVVSDIPSAEPKKGEWIKHDEERDYCSVCKHIFKTRTLTKQDKWTTYVDDLGYNFCPNCGCRMR